MLIIADESMMQGYYKLPPTREVLVDGVLHTGDLGSFDEDGNLHIKGRKKEVLVMPGGTRSSCPSMSSRSRGAGYQRDRRCPASWHARPGA